MEAREREEIVNRISCMVALICCIAFFLLMASAALSPILLLGVLSLLGPLVYIYEH